LVLVKRQAAWFQGENREKVGHLPNLHTAALVCIQKDKPLTVLKGSYLPECGLARIIHGKSMNNDDN